MKKYPCEKCGTKHRITFHHLAPRVFYGRKGETICLCEHCHHQVESIILAIEHHRSGFPYGNRYKLDRDEYIYIAENFCRKSFA